MVCTVRTARIFRWTCIHSVWNIVSAIQGHWVGDANSSSKYIIIEQTSTRSGTTLPQWNALSRFIEYRPRSHIHIYKHTHTAPKSKCKVALPTQPTAIHQNVVWKLNLFITSHCCWFINNYYYRRTLDYRNPIIIIISIYQNIDSNWQIKIITSLYNLIIIVLNKFRNIKII